MSAGVEPGIAAAEALDVKIAAVQVPLIEIGDLELAARRRFQLAHRLDRAFVVEIQAGHRVVRFRRLRLFDDLQRAISGIEFDHAIALGIVDPAGEHGRAARLRRRVAQHEAQIVAVEDVVAEDQRGRLPREKVASDQECLGDAAGVRLDRVGKLDPPAPSVAKQPLELIDLLRCRDDQDFADVGQHQRRQGIIDQRLVVDRKQLLGGRQRQRMQPRSAAARQNDALAVHASGL